MHIMHIMTFLFHLQVTMIVWSYSNLQLIICPVWWGPGRNLVLQQWTCSQGLYTRCFGFRLQAFFENSIKKICRNMQENMKISMLEYAEICSIFKICQLHITAYYAYSAYWQYAEYAQYRQCTIILHIIWHIGAYYCIFVDRLFAYLFAYSAYFAYRQYAEYALYRHWTIILHIIWHIDAYYCIFIDIFLHIYMHILHILHIAICRICTI